MSREELEKLLGGYAPGTLSREERMALAEGALEHQEIFDQLAREETLREALADPAERARLLAALGAPRRSLWDLIFRPAVLAPAAAALLVAGYFAVRPPAVPPPQQVAQLRTPQNPGTDPTVPPAPAARAIPKPKDKSAPRPALLPEPEMQIAAAQPSPPPAALPGPARPEPKAEVSVMAETPLIVPERPSAMAFTSGSAEGRRQRAGAALLSRTAAAVPLPLNWFAAKRGRDGSFVPLAAGETLRPGDAARLVLRPAANGHLAVWQREASGGRRILFSGPVQSGTSYIVPAEGALQYETAGARYVYARLTGVEEPPAEAGAMGIRLEVR